MQQRTEFRRFEKQCIAHDQCWDQGGESFVERIVERTHAKHYAQRRTPHLRRNTVDDIEAGRDAVEVFERIDGGVNVFNGTIEFLDGVGK